MQSLLESTIPKTTNNNNPNSPSRTIQVGACILIVTISLYISFFLLPSFSETDLIPDTNNNNKKNTKHNNNNNNDNNDHHHDENKNDASIPTPSPMVQRKPRPRHSDKNKVNLNVDPWGYNKNRNIPRWKAIKASIEKDLVQFRNRHDEQQQQDHHRFVLVDYGSDQGFFSISAANEFKKDGIFVVSVEMGGVGGEIWKKKDSINEGENDVLSIQERKVAQYVQQPAADHDPTAFMICQTKIEPKMFFDLAAAKQAHRYQFVLSVFHWFDLPTRKEFEEAIVTLFKNSQTTFIELPTIGDRSSLIRKQVGWNRFEKWYDGRSDIEQIILDAAKSQKFPIRVEKIVSVQWLKWTRDMYRVDWDVSAEGGGEQQQQHHDDLKFTCKTRRSIYGCNVKREKLQECNDI